MQPCRKPLVLHLDIMYTKRAISCKDGWEEYADTMRNSHRRATPTTGYILVLRGISEYWKPEKEENNVSMQL